MLSLIHISCVKTNLPWLNFMITIRFTIKISLHTIILVWLILYCYKTPSMKGLVSRHKNFHWLIHTFLKGSAQICATTPCSVNKKKISITYPWFHNVDRTRLTLLDFSWAVSYTHLLQNLGGYVGIPFMFMFVDKSFNFFVNCSHHQVCIMVHIWNILF